VKKKTLKLKIRTLHERCCDLERWCRVMDSTLKGLEMQVRVLKRAPQHIDLLDNLKLESPE